MDDRFDKIDKKLDEVVKNQGTMAIDIAVLKVQAKPSTKIWGAAGGLIVALGIMAVALAKSL